MRFLLPLLLLIPFNVFAAEINVAVASNFATTAKEIAKLYEDETGNKINLSIGSSGKHFAQIRHGAPFHIFLSADQEKPAALEGANLAIADSRFTYAEGQLVLVSNPSAAQADAEQFFKSGQFERMAIANPKLAPYGQAAMETIQNLGLLQNVKSKLITGENIAQTFQFLKSGNVELALVAKAQLDPLNDEKVHNIWLIPNSLYKPIKQDAILLKSAADNEVAMDFYRYLRHNKVIAIIESYGYHVPQADEITTK